MSSLVPKEITSDHYNKSVDNHQYPTDVEELHKMLEELAESLWESRYGSVDVDTGEAVKDYRKLTGVLHQYERLHAEEWLIKLAEDGVTKGIIDNTLQVRGSEYNEKQFSFDLPDDKKALKKEVGELSRRLANHQTSKREFEETEQSIQMYQRLAGALSQLEQEHNEKWWVIFEEEGPVFVFGGDGSNNSDNSSAEIINDGG